MVDFPDAELELKVDNLDRARSDIDGLCRKNGDKVGQGAALGTKQAFMTALT